MTTTKELSLQEMENLQGGWEWPSADCVLGIVGVTAAVVGVLTTGPAGASVVAAVSGSVGFVASVAGTIRSCA